MYTRDWNMVNFLNKYPEFKCIIPPLIVSDPEYMVRTQHQNDGTIYNLEFGYKDDGWQLPPPKRKKSMK